MLPSTAPAPSAPDAFRPETRRGVDGFYHAARNADGQWWLVDPTGAAVWGKAVHAPRAALVPGDGAIVHDSAARLRGWGFNAVGVGGDGTGGQDGFAFMAAVDFCAAAPVVTGPALRLPDVFDPRWPAVAQQHAATVCAPLLGNKNLIGWVMDDGPAWAQPTPGHAQNSTTAVSAHAPAAGQLPGEGVRGWPSLLQLCLSLEPNFAAYHAAWEFALALHGGRLDALARSWGVKLPNKEVVREMTRAELGIATRGYLRDEARWTREFARRYFTTTAAAVRAADPNHLLLGCRFIGLAGPHVLAECVYPAVDIAMPDWRELPAFSAHSGQASPGANNASPVIAAGVCWTGNEFLKLPTAARVLRLTSVEWMLRRGRTALERAARHPAVVGYVWAQWQDEPGEQPPFARGLVHVNGAEAREHTELLTEFNRRADALRRSASGHPPS
jgi:hypothetical protein